MSVLCRRLPRADKFLNLLYTNGAQVSQIGRKFANSSRRSAPHNIFKLSLIGVSVGAVVGTGYSIHQLNKTNTHIVTEQSVILPLKEPPNVAPTRRVRYLNDDSGLKLTLFQYQTCPFCCKVRAFLDYNEISYDVIEVDPVLRQAIKWSNYKKVPILLAKIDSGYQPLNDSSMIMSAITTYLQDRDINFLELVKYYPLFSYKDEGGSAKRDIMNKYFIMFNGKTPDRSKDELEEERKWRKWVDDVFVHTLSPNVYRTSDEALQAFMWFSETGGWEKTFPTWERLLIIYVGASAMWLIGKKLKKKYNLGEDVRQSLYNESNKWALAVRQKGTPFLGGDRPNLADLSVYGVLSSIEGCDAFKDLLENSSIERQYDRPAGGVFKQLSLPHGHVRHRHMFDREKWRTRSRKADPATIRDKR